METPGPVLDEEWVQYIRDGLVETTPSHPGGVRKKFKKLGALSDIRVGDIIKFIVAAVPGTAFYYLSSGLIDRSRR